MPCSTIRFQDYKYVSNSDYSAAQFYLTFLIFKLYSQNVIDELTPKSTIANFEHWNSESSDSGTTSSLDDKHISYTCKHLFYNLCSYIAGSWEQLCTNHIDNNDGETIRYDVRK